MVKHGHLATMSLKFRITGIDRLNHGTKTRYVGNSLFSDNIVFLDAKFN
jgi:hypothetical protein